MRHIAEAILQRNKGCKSGSTTAQRLALPGSKCPRSTFARESDRDPDDFAPLLIARFRPRRSGRYLTISLTMKSKKVRILGILCKSRCVRIQKPLVNSGCGSITRTRPLSTSPIWHGSNASPKFDCAANSDPRTLLLRWAMSARGATTCSQRAGVTFSSCPSKPITLCLLRSSGVAGEPCRLTYSRLP